MRQPENRQQATQEHPPGIAMLYVIAITALIALMIGVMMTQYVMRTRTIRSSIQDLQNVYTAEAGVKKAFYYLTTEKGIDWRTGTLMQDVPLVEQIFFEKEDEVEISVIDDCGYLRISSQTTSLPGRHVSILAAGILPEQLRHNLHVVSPKPLILGSGSYVEGVIRLNHEPVFRGGSIEGVLETNMSLTLPPLLKQTFTQSADYFRSLLSTPEDFPVELFAPQVFSPERALSERKIFVNGAVLVENKLFDSLWYAGNSVTIVSTADVQISGKTKLTNPVIAAIGSIRLLDNAELRNARVYSETGVELRENALFSGIVIAPEIMISEKARTLEPTVVYCGPPHTQGKITINTDAPIHCTLVNCSSGEESAIELDDDVEMTGFIYSLAPITLHGSVNGYVFCRGFREETGSHDSVNTNILSGAIRPLKNQPAIAIPVILNDIQDFHVVEWQEY